MMLRVAYDEDLANRIRELIAAEPRRGGCARADGLSLRHEARYRAECYEADHKELSIEVLAPAPGGRGSRG